MKLTLDKANRLLKCVNNMLLVDRNDNILKQVKYDILEAINRLSK